MPIVELVPPGHVRVKTEFGAVEHVTAVISRHDAQELLTERSRVASEIGEPIGTGHPRWHVLATAGSVNVTDMRFSRRKRRSARTSCD